MTNRKATFIFLMAVLILAFPSVRLSALDSDNDGMPDAWEALYALNLSFDDSGEDPDNDALINLVEYQYSTNPLLSDTDNDGLLDGEEVQNSIQAGEERCINSPYDYYYQTNSSVCFMNNQYVVVYESAVYWQPDSYRDCIVVQILDINGEKVTRSLVGHGYTEEDDKCPVVASNGVDAFIAFGTPYPSYDVKGRIMNADGTFKTSTALINTYTDDDQNTPAISTDGTNYLIVWESEEQDGDGLGIYAQRMDSSQNPLSAEFRINTATLNDQWDPDVDCNSETYLVAWTSAHTGKNNIYAQLLNLEGEKIGSEILISSNISGAYPAIAHMDNMYLVVWCGGRRINGRMLDTNGEFITDEFEIATIDPDSAMSPNVFLFPDVVSNGETFLVVWQHGSHIAGAEADIIGQEINRYGYKIGSKLRLNQTTPYSQSLPAISTDGENYCVVWQSFSFEAHFDIYGCVTSIGEPVLVYDPLNADLDNDGLLDGVEVKTYGTNPFLPDTDGDGISDGMEILVYFTNPHVIDTDNDGFSDATEINEILTDPLLEDTDNDGLSDGVEVQYTIERGEEIQVNTYTPADQDNPSIAYNGNNYVVVWESFYNDDDCIFAQRFDRDGNKVGSRIIVEEDNSYNQLPVINNLENEFMIVWHDGMYEVESVQMRMDGSFKPFSNRTLFSLYNERYIAFSGDPNNYIVVWQSNNDGDGLGISGKILNQPSSIYGSLISINTYTVNDQAHPAVDRNAETYLVAWDSNSSCNYKIYAQLFSLEGEKIGGELLVSSHSSFSQTYPAGTHIDGLFFLVWIRAGTDIYGRLLDQSGRFVTDEFQINATTGDAQQRPVVVSNGKNYFVIWQTKTTSNIVGQLISRSGHKIRSEVTLNSYTTNNQRNPAVISDGENYFLVWESDGQDKSNYGVYGCITKPSELVYVSDPLIPDMDNDGLLDGQEVNTYHTDPLMYDTDNDGLSDGDEILVYFTEPLVSDTDNDGLPDGEEVIVHHTNPLLLDTDNDGASDKFEVDNGYNPLVTDTLDNDNDGLWNLAELFTYNTDPDLADTDNDALSDYEEVIIYLSNPLDNDSDDDGLLDGREIQASASPLLVDTDNDGLTDLEEVEEYGTSPSVADTDNDGLTDAAEVDMFLAFGNEFRINTETSNDQDTPSVAFNGVNYVVVWENYCDNERIFAQQYDCNGNPAGDEIEVYEENGIDHKKPVASGISGKSLIAWTRENISYISESYDVYGRIMNPNGSFETSAEALNAERYLQQKNPAIATDGVNYLIVWQSQTLNQDGSGFGVYGRLFDVNQNPITSETLFNTTTHNNQYEPAVDCSGETYLVAWSSAASTNYDICAQLVSLTGVKIGTEISVHIPKSGHQRNVSIAHIGSNYLVVWDSCDGSFNSDYDIYGRILDNDGLFITDEFLINTVRNGDQITPAVASNGRNFLVVWHSANNLDVFGQFLDPNGQKIRPEFRVNVYTDNIQQAPAIASDGKTYFVVWESAQDGSLSGIYGRVIDGDLTTYDPLVADMDNDGLLDGQEVNTYHTDPRVYDSDNDALNDGDEVLIYFTNPFVTDSDNDGLPDGAEANVYNTNPLLLDTDNDGLSDSFELANGSNPNSSDTDNDGMPDDWEIQTGFNPCFNDAVNDEDNDNLSNLSEYQLGSDPLKEDSNDNGISDMDEFFPDRLNTVHLDSDNDGLIDNVEGEESGSLDYTFFSDNDGGRCSVACSGVNYCVVWEDDNGDWNIYGQILDYNGNRIGSVFLINTYTSNTQANPSVASNGETYCVVWESTDQIDDKDVFCQILSLNGAKQGGEIRVNTYTTGTQYDAQITSNGENYCVMWRDYGQNRLCGQIVDVIGNKLISDSIQSTSFFNSMLGRPVVGASSNNFLKEYRFMTGPYLCSSSGNIASAYYYGQINSAIKWAIYSEDSVSGALTLIAETFELNTGSLGWHQFDFQQIVQVEEGTKYRLVALNATSTNSFYYDSGEGGYAPGTYAQDFPDAITAYISWPYQISVYLPYVQGDQPETTHFDGWLALNETSSKIACSFNAAETGVLKKIRLRLKREPQAVSGTAWISIYSDINDNPGTQIGKTSCSITIASISTETNGGNVDFMFQTGMSLTAGTKYWIVLESDNQIGGISSISWSYDADSQANGVGTNAFLYTAEAWESSSVTLTYATFYHNEPHDLIIKQFADMSTVDNALCSNSNDYYIVWSPDDDTGISGSSFRASTMTLEDEHECVSSGSNPAIAGNDDRYLLTYIFDKNLYGQMLDLRGNKLGLPFIINTTLGFEDSGSETSLVFQQNESVYYGYVDNPEVVSNGLSFSVVWQYIAENANYDVVGRALCVQFIDFDGTLISDELDIAYDEDVFSVCSDNNKYFLIRYKGTDDDYFYGSFLKRTYQTDIDNPDTDNDTLTDGDEVYVHKTDPLSADSDNDGMTDGWEIGYSLNPLFDDSTLDQDNDGVTNISEFQNNSNPWLSDSDNDGIPDATEIDLGLNPTSDDTVDDDDNDGLSNFDELYMYNTQKDNPDSDNDGMMDGWEIQVGLQPLFLDSEFDNDNDKLSNLSEFEYMTHPFHYDSNDNGISDLEEIFPINSYFISPDTDNDGLADSLEGPDVSFAFRINTTTEKGQNKVVSASNGTNYLAVWRSYEQDGSDWGIFAQLFDLDGSKIGSELQVNTYTLNKQDIPRVASNGTNYVVVWLSEQDGSENGIYGQVVNKNGVKIGAEFQINDYTTGYQRYPQIVSNGTNFLVIWSSDGSTKGRILDTAGSIVGAELSLGSVYDITSDGTRYMRVWDTDTTVYGQLIEPDGSLGVVKVIYETDPATGYHAGYSRIASNGTTYLAVFISNGTIYGQILDLAGNKLGHPFSINTTLAYYEADPPFTSCYSEELSFSNPVVASNGKGYFVVWFGRLTIQHSCTSTSWQTYLYGQIINDIGNLIGDEMLIQHRYELSETFIPSISSDKQNYFLAYESIGDVYGSWGVFGMLLNKTYGTDMMNPDSDLDGLKDGEEVYLLKCNPYSVDTDNDGMGDGDEVYAGMAANDRESLFSIAECSTEPSTGGIKVTWYCTQQSGRLYTIFWRDNVGDTWNAVDYSGWQNDVTDNGDGTKSWVDLGLDDGMSGAPSSCAVRFYRIMVEFTQ